jgi:L-lactate dehydrogenase complex protein LldG
MSGGDARGAILGRIRGALRDVPAGERPEDVVVPRAYRRVEDEPGQDRMELFAARVEEYRATVHQSARSTVGEVASSVLRDRDVRRVGVPDDLPVPWRPEGVELVREEDLATHDLDALDGALIGCALAIADTGTIVLDAGRRQGRRALSLVPDYLLCVVFGDQIAGGVPEAVERLAGAAREGRPITLISGPSATSDIELERVEGVHGPRTLDVVLAD